MLKAPSMCPMCPYHYIKLSESEAEFFFEELFSSYLDYPYLLRKGIEDWKERFNFHTYFSTCLKVSIPPQKCNNLEENGELTQGILKRTFLGCTFSFAATLPIFHASMKEKDLPKAYPKRNNPSFF